MCSGPRVLDPERELPLARRHPDDWGPSAKVAGGPSEDPQPGEDIPERDLGENGERDDRSEDVV